MRIAAYLTAIAGAAGLTIISTSLRAQDSDAEALSLPNRYEVEVIIFRHLDQSRNTPEIPAAASMIEASPFDLDLTEQPGETGALASINAESGQQSWATSALENETEYRRLQQSVRRSGPTPSFVLLPMTLEFPDFYPFDKTAFSLNRVYNRIDRLDAYQPLMHLGWIQPVKSTGEARPFLISNPSAEPVGVTGTVTLYKERYLHLALNLALESPPAVNASSPGTEPPPDRVFGLGTFTEPEVDSAATSETHKLLQSRRIRLSTTHYFDHPLFGVIATVNEIETVVDPDAASTDAG